ncbi:NAD(P)-dependent alcohol dehydrogenase [Amnibacterium sp. CER49]|uniref:NAD(P)-dependent alcohol dehydrogenase n=1 Tax=Amnibacterium sp. CER49 TaxID=3039161 RepID=UPI0024490680|nr:NAD(P)-dependent alcohol dehydrogenase [Amnibacterium sp. CER49]MDH2444668.1 NAD(P)-dependent alcohol dehydrogenase [Amnibacterium sp. CER49]
MTDGVPTTMRASVLHGAQHLELEERPVPALEPDQVLVRITAVGVCGSDVHFWHEGALGEWTVTEPLVLGHESGGVIVAVGRDVPGERIGERVSIEPQRPEPLSAETLAGHYNLDPAMRFYAVPGTDGAFAEYAAIQSHFAWAVPDSMSDEAAALLEPLSVAVATIRKAGITVGSRLLIAGAGPIGVAVAQVARAYGAAEVLVSDVDEARREQALTFGATRALAPGEVTDDLAVDAFVDASGAAPAVAAGVRAVRPAGSVVLVGMGAPEMPLPVAVIQNRELVVTGIFRYVNTWPTAIGLVESGAVDLDRMVTGHFGLAEVEDALASTRRPGTLKSVVHPQR